jgi:hypothetical protein
MRRMNGRSSVSLKMAVFWDVAPCSLVDIDRRFRAAYYLHHQGVDIHNPDDADSKLY